MPYFPLGVIGAIQALKPGKILGDDELAAAGVGVAHHFGGKAYVKETLIEAGASLAQHAHGHDHLSYLVYGLVTLTTDEGSRELEGPACITIPAHQAHGVFAHTKTLWLCVWGTECTDPATVDAEISK